ncbi:hypothetical protein ALI144C_31040 [Actinosynnema sp. ALI-1.44]|uniref:hypothetical protein n=1 Tax=Actinosynnema sp. ALI-1.44 TaxID=1933779 RepID=UPI00097C00C8|nr:hypothetical protein [Actinosynnema sp. ALI-1.44]ONI77856.1 hypothetical protein ALI144C_31040 [Actinosynnema sp. ALI-1.44]
MTAQEREADPVQVLRQAIVEALPRLQTVESDANELTSGRNTAEMVTETVNTVLLAFTRAAAPFGNELAARAAQQPGGPLATAMSYLRDAFARLATGDVSPACTSMALAQSELNQLD